jgi:hypothetical protein
MTYFFLYFVSINICEKTSIIRNWVHNEARRIITNAYAYYSVQKLLFICLPTKRKHKEEENYRNTDVRLSQRFAAGVDSALGSLHHADVGIVSDDSGCMLPPPSESKLKMEVVCTSETSTTLFTSTRCKGQKAALTSAEWFILKIIR